MERILLVEDDEAIVSSLTEYLKTEGFEMCNAPGQQEAEEAIHKGKIALVLLDISLANGSGFAVCRYAKELKLPVIFLTASGDENSVVKGLDMGADDYIAKPFRPRELVSRIRNVLRRYAGAKSVVAIGNVMIDTESGTVTKCGMMSKSGEATKYGKKSLRDEVTKCGKMDNECENTQNREEIELSALEYRLLMVFVNNRGRLLSRNKLLEDIWDIAGDYVNDNTLTVYIKRLREKIEDDPQNPMLIKTIRGMGYRMD